MAGPKELPATQIGKSTFFKEDEPPTLQERLAVKGLLTDAHVGFVPGEEAAAISGLLHHLIDLAGRSGGAPPLPEPPDTSHIEGLKAIAGNHKFRAVAELAEQLRQDLGIWTVASDQRAQRESSWSKLGRLLEHTGSLEFSNGIRVQRDAILSDRLLLTDPDPVKPLLDQLCIDIRKAVANGVRGLSDQFAKERSSLEASASWSDLSPMQQAEVLSVSGLEAPIEPDISSVEAVLASLDAQPLSSYQDRIDAMPSKAAAARRRMAQILDPEPSVISVQPPGATIRTEAEAEAYVKALGEQIIGHISAGEIVII